MCPLVLTSDQRRVSRVDVTALSRSSGWQQSAWTDSDWQSSWLGADVLTKGLELRFRLRLEPSLHDCFGGKTVRDSTRCFSVLLLRWQWGEQEWVESSLSDTGVVCSENLLNRTALPTTSSVLCPPRAPEREQTQSQHEQLLVCTVRSLVETNIMQFCRFCPLMCCHCEMRPPRVRSSSMSSVPSATSRFTSDASRPGQIDTWWFLPFLVQHVGVGSVGSFRGAVVSAFIAVSHACYGRSATRKQTNTGVDPSVAKTHGQPGRTTLWWHFIRA